jgi:hypothetical protein
VQVRTPDVADEQRVAGEDEPRLLVASAPVGDDVRVVSSRVAGRGERPHDGVAELHDVAVPKSNAIEFDVRARGQVGGRPSGLDEGRQARDVVGLDVRLEDGNDRCADPLRPGDIRVNELDMGVDDCDLRVRHAPEQVARARAFLDKEGPEDHRFGTR